MNRERTRSWGTGLALFALAGTVGFIAAKTPLDGEGYRQSVSPAIAGQIYESAQDIKEHPMRLPVELTIWAGAVSEAIGKTLDGE